MPYRDPEVQRASQLRSWYRRGQPRNNPETIRARTAALRARVQELKTGPCMDCGQTFDPVCMDFDHRDAGGKFKDVSVLISRGYGWAKIEAEIAKCDLVCSNCHRLRTKERGRVIQSTWWR